jgi:hypothetical protein
MDKLGDYIISDEEEPRQKTRKTLAKIPQKTISKKVIRKSNFAQVNINIYQSSYRKWIEKFNSKIYEHFQKVQNV